MALGIVFTYLLVFALAAPVLWLMWWAVTSIPGDGRMRPAPVPTPRDEALNRARMQSRYDYPRPADLRLASRPGAVAVYSANGGGMISTCSGPDHAGKCSRPLADGTVPCAGCVLALPQPIRGSLEWHIPQGYQACLLGSYAAFREAPSAN